MKSGIGMDHPDKPGDDDLIVAFVFMGPGQPLTRLPG